jgi:hypothetical protein
MATQSAVITFALPEDTEADQLQIYASTTQDGTYDLVHTVAYEYGEAQYEFDALNDTYWYRIKFYNSRDGESGPISEAVYGGQFSQAAPFLAVGTTSDGAAFATSQDLYDYSGLQPADVSPSRASASLKRARAWIDFRVAELGIDRLEAFATDVARRKFNASLRILKEAEINIALGHLYTSLSDDLIIANMRGGESAGAGSVSIGNTSVQGDALSERSENIIYLATLAARYEATGEKLLTSLDTNSVRLIGSDQMVRSPKFRYPFNGF